ncbi:MAG TPA: HAMP domain-containing sensor histidine kinase [Ignavibacteria bacterium]
MKVETGLAIEENGISGFIMQILNALPQVAAILNSKRKIVFANEALIRKFGSDTLENILSKKPGEAFSCKSLSPETECGDTENCKYCSTIKAFNESVNTNSTVSSEWRFTSKVNGRFISYDYHVITSPLNFNGKPYTILTLSDISDEKRRKFLERIFFHDIINLASSINGILEVIEESDQHGKIFELIDIAKSASSDLIEEIMAQRELLSAENNELNVKNGPINSIKILSELIKRISHSKYAENKTILLSKDSSDVVFTSDISLLKRVLLNMIINALEATPFKGRVMLGCIVNTNSITFWVKNPGVIQQDVGMQIFQRSFSTKGTNRGLGSYSMKLLGEQYLKGKVYFKSSKEKDTTFYIKFSV